MLQKKHFWKHIYLGGLKSFIINIISFRCFNYVGESANTPYRPQNTSGLSAYCRWPFSITKEKNMVILKTEEKKTSKCEFKAYNRA